MSTTTIRLPDDLKARLSKVAKKLGSSSHALILDAIHALILDAISERVEAEERRSAFLATAEKRYAKLAESGETISWEDMKGYIKGRTSGKKVNRPNPRKLVR